MELQGMKTALLKSFRQRQKRKERGIDTSITSAGYLSHLAEMGPRTVQMLYANMRLENSAKGRKQLDETINKMVNHSGFMSRQSL